MPDRRIKTGVDRGPGFTITIDGEAVTAYGGETLAAAMIAGDIWTFRQDTSGRRRAPYCNMGICFECLVAVQDDETGQNPGDGRGWRRVRACMTTARPGMTVRRIWP